MIYRRFYGTRAALRLFLLMWFVMSVTGLIVDRLFTLVHAVPGTHHTSVMSGRFDMGWTLALNVVALLLALVLWTLSRSAATSSLVATDPVCGMAVDTSAPAATRQRDGVEYYFCSLRCAERFDERGASSVMVDDPHGEHVDPICSMRVSSDGLHALGEDGVTYYFCSEGCRDEFLHGPSAPAPQTIELGRKKTHE